MRDINLYWIFSKYDESNMSNRVMIIIILAVVIIGSNCLVQLINNDSYNSRSLHAVSKTNETSFAKYENSSFGISIDYPSKWKQVEDDRGSWFRTENESANVRIESLPFQNQTLDQLTISQTNLTAQQFPDQKILDSNVTKIGNNYTAHKLLFTFPEEPADPKGTHMREMKLWTTNNDRAYIFSYFTTNDTFDSYLPVIQKMIESFSITPLSK
jgi:hypothetical protein